MICCLAVKLDVDKGSKVSSSPDFTIRNKRGFNALQYAALKGNNSATRSVLSASARLNNPELIDTKKDDGYTSLHLACLNGRKEVARCLIEANADLEVTDIKGRTVLHAAVHQGQAAIIELLLSTSKNNVIMNKADRDGETPLHLALCREGPPPVDATFDTAPIIFELIEKARNQGVNDFRAHAVAFAAYLVGQGANPAAKNKLGHTPSDLVTDYNSRAFILGFTCKRSLEGISDKKGYKKVTPSIYESLATSEDVTVKKELSLPVLAGNETSPVTECLVCSEMVRPICFEPCGHKIVCSDCGRRMKRCLVCKIMIESKVASVTPPTTNFPEKLPRSLVLAHVKRRVRDIVERVLDKQQ